MIGPDITVTVPVVLVILGALCLAVDLLAGSLIIVAWIAGRIVR